MPQLERIVAALGGELFESGRRALIPGPGHSPSDRSVALLEAGDGRILIHCFSPKDDWRDVRRALAARGLLASDGDVSAKGWAETAPTSLPRGQGLVRAQRFWEGAREIGSTLAERYLTRRGVSPSNLRRSAVRFHPMMTSLEDRARRPALVSAIVNRDDALQGVEITLLSPNGAKAALATPRRVVGKMMGGAVRLGEALDELVVGEGLESAASASIAMGLPAWALLGAHNLALFEPPAQVQRLVVAIDNDEAGRAAFQHISRRLSHRLHLECAPPPSTFNDWNDWARVRASS